ncbi:MAG: carbohydrate binding domain-containing protein [Spirochaetes bacterium]|nr:carbohydrate binding domain-containing protein [Spirochaetota bacterium]
MKKFKLSVILLFAAMLMFSACGGGGGGGGSDDPDNPGDNPGDDPDKTAPGEMIKNGDFSLSDLKWGTYIEKDSGAVARIDFTGGQCTIDITNGGLNHYCVQISTHYYLAVEAGKTYTILYSLKGTAGMYLSTLIQESGTDVDGDGDLWNYYSWKKTIATGDWQTDSFTFTSPISNPGMTISFNVGSGYANGNNNGTRIIIDNVSMKEIFP